MKREVLVYVLEEMENKYGYSMEEYGYGMRIKVDTEGIPKIWGSNKSLIKDKQTILKLAREAKELYDLEQAEWLEIEQFCKRYPDIDWRQTSKKVSNFDAYHEIRYEYPSSFEALSKILTDCLRRHIEVTSVKEAEQLADELKRLNEIKKLEHYQINLIRNACVLEDGDYMIIDNEETKLIFLVSPQNVENYLYSANQEVQAGLNIFWKSSEVEFMYGTFYEGKDTKKYFQVCSKTEAKHLLIRTREKEEIQHTMYDRKSRRYKYYIVPIDYQNTYSKPKF